MNPIITDINCGTLCGTVSHVFPFQARQDILAQDLAEAVSSQVELAEQLKCYREENEQLLREKQVVCLYFNAVHHQEVSCKIRKISTMESAVLVIPLPHSAMTCIQ